MDFCQQEIKTEYQNELNTLLNEVRAKFGDEAATLFVYFVSAFSTAGGRAATAAQRLKDLTERDSITLSFCNEHLRFYFPESNGIQYLNPYGSNRSELTNYIISAAFISHRGMKKLPPGDHFELAIRVVQEEYGKLLV